MQGTRVGATPVARGIALPHIQDATVPRPELVLVRSPNGIPIPTGAADDTPDDTPDTDERTAHALFFLVSPEHNPGQHLRILAQIAGRADDDGFLDAWLRAEDEQQLKEALLRDEHFLALTVEEDGRTGALAGRALREVRWPEDCLVALIRRRGETIVPGGNTVLEPGDRLTVLGNPEGIEALRALYASSAVPVVTDAASGPAGPDVLSPEETAGTPEAFSHRRLLVGLGLRNQDDALVRFAGLFSRVTTAEQVRFVHIFRMPSIVGQVYGRPQYQDPFADAAAFLKEALEALVRRRFGSPPGVAVTCSIVEGTPLLELLRLAQEDGTDLLVAGRDRQGRTLAEKLARKAPCSVLVVPEDAPDALRRILVAVDFSTSTADAVRMAVTLAAASGLEELHLLHVYDTHRAVPSFPGAPQKAQGRRLAEEYFTASLQQLDLQGLTAVPHFMEGENVPGIIGERAEALEADLVVIGTRGHSSSSIVLMGSVAEELVRWARVPVLAVKRKGATLSLLKAMFRQ
jgi:nucleotide-binding universal stress UspA family protein/mannitol/fructose-specific phosphotransferase system IIA component (Ntr-type)